MVNSEPPRLNLKLRPVDPINIFFAILFMAAGGLLCYWAVRDPSIGRSGMWAVAVALGVMFLYTGVTLISCYISVNKTGLRARQAWFDGTSMREIRRTHLPRTRTLAFDDIEKVSFMRVSAGRSTGAVICMTMQNGAKQVLNLGPYRKKDCQELVAWLREHGLFVYIDRDLLGKNFT